MEATLRFSFLALLLAVIITAKSISAVPLDDEGVKGDLELTRRICAECDYFLNGCPLPDGIFGVNCPQNGTATCRDCLELQGITTEVSEQKNLNEETDHKEVKATSTLGQRRERSTGCLHYGNICSGRVCCHHEGLICRTNSEGRGRNHLVCGYD